MEPRWDPRKDLGGAGTVGQRQTEKSFYRSGITFSDDEWFIVTTGEQHAETHMVMAHPLRSHREVG